MLRSWKFRNNEIKSRFELLMENAVAYVEYIKQDSKIIVFKTEVPETISKIDDSIEYLMKRILRHCEENNTELDIRCPFAKAIIGKYPASKHNP